MKHSFLQQHPNVMLHFTPTYSSWLNQVEIWFSKLQRDVIDRGIFTSVADLKRKDPALYPSLSEDSETLSLEILRSHQTDSGMVAIAQGQPTRSSRAIR